MKFHFTLIGVLCAHALAQNARVEDRKLKRFSGFSPTPKGGGLADASAVIVKKTPQSQSNGASIMSSCSSAIDEINVEVQGLVSKNGVEYSYLPMTADKRAACFESYNNTVLGASDLFSCCDAAAAEGYNSFRFDGGVCTGFKAWLSPIYTKLPGNGLVSPGLFVAKRKLSNFTSRAPTFSTTTHLGVARIEVDVTNIIDACPYSKRLKVTTYSKTESMKLEILIDEEEYEKTFYHPDLCDDNPSTDKRTVTISILDWDGSELASVTKVPSSGLTGRHLLSNGVCVLYSGSPLRHWSAAHRFCGAAKSRLPFGDGFLPFANLLQDIAGFAVPVMDFWTYAILLSTNWRWYINHHKINMSLVNVQSLNSSIINVNPALIANVTDNLMYMVAANTVHHTVCIDAPYIIM